MSVLTDVRSRFCIFAVDKKTRVIHLRITRVFGSRGGTRTHTPLREPDFESSASANSATRPGVRRAAKAIGLFREGNRLLVIGVAAVS